MNYAAFAHALEEPFAPAEFSVLLVDDDGMDREYFSALLSSSNDYIYRHQSVSSLAEARAILRTCNKPYDCILLDYRLPDGTGEDLMSELQAMPEAPAVVVFTGQNDKQEALRMMRLGAHDYLDKRQINKDNLSRAIRYGIERAKGAKMQLAFTSQRQMSELQGDFIAIITHEFKNPIHIINHTANQIKKRVLDQITHLEEYFSRIHSCTARMQNLLEQTTEFAKFDPASLTVKREKISLHTLLQQEIAKLQLLHPKREFRIGSGIAVVPNIVTDRRLCSQVIENIVGNAVKYSPEDKSINFLFSISETHLSLQIQDHGRGIPEEDLARIGKKFFRAGNCGQECGTGMGLYLVKSLMPILDGTFHIQSRENKGTVVTLSFPLSTGK